MTRCLLNLGKTSAWELPYINSKSVVIWAAPSAGSYTACQGAGFQLLSTPLHQITINES